MTSRGSATKMIAVPAQAILRQDRDEIEAPATMAEAPLSEASQACLAGASESISVETILTRVDLDASLGQAQAIAPIPEQNRLTANARVRLATGIAIINPCQGNSP